MRVLARNCAHWYDTGSWQGNCKTHHWKHDKYSQEAECRDCPDFVDKYAKYQLKEANGPKRTG